MRSTLLLLLALAAPGCAASTTAMPPPSSCPPAEGALLSVEDANDVIGMPVVNQPTAESIVAWCAQTIADAPTDEAARLARIACGDCAWAAARARGES